MRIAIIADVFPPLRSSGAVQLRDLSLEFVRQGHQPTVMIPSSEISLPWVLENMDGVQVLRLKAPRTKDTNYVRRTIGELLMPFVMRYNLQKTSLADVRWDGVVWYSPTIFLGPLANVLKKTSACRSYLIVRDIFPEWAVDMGLLGRGLPYRFFKAIEYYQYSVADVIGVQTSSNLTYFDNWSSKPKRRVEVLQNWLADAPNKGATIKIASSPLAGRTIFVYAGNMGVAQGMNVIIDLAERLQNRSDIGFLFVGRGSDAKKLQDTTISRGLDNVLFYDEIDPTEIPGLFAQCHIGIVMLDPRHKTHNIPGKFLTYMQAGLPVLASINPGNNLVELIAHEKVGFVCTDHSADTLERLAKELVDEVLGSNSFVTQCQNLSKKLFSPEVAVKQIVNALM